MGKCVNCGKTGLLLKLNKNGMCSDCEAELQRKITEEREIVHRMQEKCPWMNRDECLFADYVIGVVESVHPEYELAIDKTTQYFKIYIPDGYGVNSAILTMFRIGSRAKYFTLNSSNNLNEGQAQRLKDARDKKGRVNISDWSDIKEYSDMLVPTAEYLWSTYEIEKYREAARNRPKSELLDKLGLSVDLSASSGGIEISVNRKDDN